jgi:hypothetical protein
MRIIKKNLKKDNLKTIAMKNLLLLLLTAFTLCCCNKDDDKPKTELEKLPPATQIGANTIGCLLNGVAFLPKGYFPFGNKSCNYTDGEDFNIRISEKINDNIRSIYIFNQNQELIVGETYLLKEENTNNGVGNYIINAVASPDPNYYTTNLNILGELKITNHNFSQAILSGTFWFDAINSEGKIIEVREGRFDMHY